MIATMLASMAESFSRYVSIALRYAVPPAVLGTPDWSRRGQGRG
jgi:hypothetical protein